MNSTELSKLIKTKTCTNILIQSSSSYIKYVSKVNRFPSCGSTVHDWIEFFFFCKITRERNEIGKRGEFLFGWSSYSVNIECPNAGVSEQTVTLNTLPEKTSRTLCWFPHMRTKAKYAQWLPSPNNSFSVGGFCVGRCTSLERNSTEKHLQNAMNKTSPD